MKRLAIILLTCAAVAAATLQPAEAEPSLTIGSKAPALDIEHWVQDGNGKFQPVTDFDSGTVYVVEFWATWCGPCISSMPHLAQLQNEYRDRGVRIVSVSDESLDEVEALLKKPYPQKEESFADVTSAYSLTTDPDGSTHRDYMQAAEQRGIPTSFVVGKTGLVEWIGHPMKLDEPLAAVVDGTWDREAFKQEMERERQFEEAVQQFGRLANQGMFEEAAKLLNDQIESTESEEYKEQWMMLRHRFRLMTGQADQETFDYYLEDLKKRQGTPYAVGQFGMMLFAASQNGGEVGPLAKETITALESEVEGAEKELQPLLYNALAQLHVIEDQLDQAIAAQEKAIEVADDRQKKRLMPFLEELKAAAEEQSAGTESPAGKE
ncbi:redoxin domain-containing protein [Roseiconus nitratireducens]|uniref:Redoxin domain-containing protein n=1 Tax=Roseiconus nitratireducens TaxID=2605748 RepID=A0A5M6D8G9_9BACT|nr:redoxin domain-containing protein [Roseiconus nitratireducens]KAA5542189.1 redoxin domain-containing protein [Roseiconus nitratireducens]